MKVTVTDSQGLSSTYGPIKVNAGAVTVKLGSKPGKVKLDYGGRTVKGGKRFETAIGFRANLSAPETIHSGGRTLHFRRWSQGGRRAQLFDVPAHDFKLKAKYK